MTNGTRLSLHDPAGLLLRAEERLFRIIKESGYTDYLGFESSATVKRYQEAGWIATAIRVDPDLVDSIGGGQIGEIYKEHRGQVLVEHEPLPFSNFPYEWAPEMLHRAASLTLTLKVDPIVKTNFGWQ